MRRLVMGDEQDRLMDLFNEARAKRTFEEREAFLTAACGGDKALRRQVEALLRAHAQAGDFLKPPSDDSLEGEGPGTVIGRYKLCEKIGEGGFGVVYVAEQEEPVRRRVALKLIKLGMDTRQVVARFEAERQALALMEHPNIAKVLDAGATENGRPYFVMDLVRGVRITDYCDQHCLPTNERLGLFMQVCHAIQHAHQKGIIHRDLKPSNILVTVQDGVPVPKVIDFGIAKATGGQVLTDKTLYTAMDQFLGTPAYTSPEQAQAAGVDIDTRSDIYNLGVLLYELLTGKTPFEHKRLVAAGLDEVRRIIREEEPPRPSTRLSTLRAEEQTTVAKRHQAEPPELIHLVQGDLDWIVMKSLEKDRTRRYETANALADDILRHLNNEPVVARPPSRAYRFQKLVRRNKLVFTAAAAVTGALVIGLGLATWLLFREQAAHRQAVAAQRQAQAQAKKSEQVALFLEDMLRSVGPSVAMGRDTTLLKEILDKTAERVGRDLKDQPEIEAELRYTVGRVYYVLGDYTKSEAMHRVALTIRTNLWGSLNTNVARSLGDLAFVLLQQGEIEEAESLFQEALNINMNLLTPGDFRIADSLFCLGCVRHVQGRYPDAERFLRRSLAMLKKLTPQHDGEMAKTLGQLSLALNAQGRPAEAESAAREALAIQTRLAGTEPLWDIECTRVQLGTALHLQHRLDEAEVTLRQAVGSYPKVVGAEHWHVVEALLPLSAVLTEKGETDEAERLAREALASSRKVGGHPDLTPRCLLTLARTMRSKGRLAEAEPLYREALTSALRLWPNNAARWQGQVHGLADVLQAQGKAAQAEQVAAEYFRPAAQVKPVGIVALRTHAQLSARHGQWKDAATDLTKLLELDPSQAYEHLQLAAVLLETGELEAYRTHCRVMMARFGGTNVATALDNTARACLLVPGAGGDVETGSQLAARALILGQGSPEFISFQFCNSLAEYRQGCYARARDWMRKAVAQPANPGGFLPAWERDAAAWAVLAMAQHHLDQIDEARATLAKANDLAKTKLPQLGRDYLGKDWVEWLIAHILLQEAKTVVEGEPTTSSTEPANPPMEFNKR